MTLNYKYVFHRKLIYFYGVLLITIGLNAPLAKADGFSYSIGRFEPYQAILYDLFEFGPVHTLKMEILTRVLRYIASF